MNPLPGSPADSSRALPGLAVRGNRSGDVLRVSGTSFAAPLVARAIANGTLPGLGGLGRSTRLPVYLRP